LQASVPRSKSGPWAVIEDTTITGPRQKASLDENLAVSVNFKINGGIRRNFVRKLWEAAYDEHDLGLRIIYSKTEEEAKGMLFNVTRNFEIPAKTLGPGDHSLEAKIRFFCNDPASTE